MQHHIHKTKLMSRLNYQNNIGRYFLNEVPWSYKDKLHLSVCSHTITHGAFISDFFSGNIQTNVLRLKWNVLYISYESNIFEKNSYSSSIYSISIRKNSFTLDGTSHIHLPNMVDTIRRSLIQHGDVMILL